MALSNDGLYDPTYAEKHPDSAGMTTCCEDNSGGDDGGDVVPGNQTGAGSPVGVATPEFIGQLYTDQTAPYGLWQATGLTSADWIALISA